MYLDLSGGESLSDDEEEHLVRLLHKLLGAKALFQLNEVGRQTNVRISDHVQIALYTTDWERQINATNRTDDEIAIMEAEEVLREEPE